MFFLAITADSLSSGPSLSATARAVVSMLPPGAEPAKMRTGLLGQSCAEVCANAKLSQLRAQAVASSKAVVIMVCLLKIQASHDSKSANSKVVKTSGKLKINDCLIISGYHFYQPYR